MKLFALQLSQAPIASHKSRSDTSTSVVSDSEPSKIQRSVWERYKWAKDPPNVVQTPKAS